MVAVTIATSSYSMALTFERVIDFEAEHTNKLAIPTWINAQPSLNTNVRSKTKQKLTYNPRLSDEELYTLIQLILGHELVVIDDNEYFPRTEIGWDNTEVDCWFEDWSAAYEGNINSEKPWNVTITLIVVRWHYNPSIEL